MNNRHFIFLFLSFLFITSCGNRDANSKNVESQKEVENQLWEEILSVHDEVMPKMATLNKLQRELKEISEINDVSRDTTQLQNVSKAIQILEQADEAMMDWMQGFQQLEALRANQKHEQILNYLENEKTAIDSVKEKMNGAIEKGRKLLDDFGS